jgi:hypothetical protein
VSWRRPPLDQVTGDLIRSVEFSGGESAFERDAECVRGRFPPRQHRLARAGRVQGPGGEVVDEVMAGSPLPRVGAQHPEPGAVVDRGELVVVLLAP